MALNLHLLIFPALLLVVQHSSSALTILPERQPDASDVILYRNDPLDKRSEPEEAKACDNEKGEACGLERFQSPTETADYLRHSLSSSSRFWGKRTRATEELKNKLISSSRFWGKRSAPTSDTNSIKGIEDLKRKLQSSSPFWGKRSVDESPSANEIDNLKQKLRSSSIFWGKRSSAEQNSGKDASLKPVSDLRNQLQAYVRVWGKRSAEEADQSSPTDGISLEQRLKASSRFWGKRSDLSDNDDEAVQPSVLADEEEAMNRVLLASGRFWESVRAASSDALRSADRQSTIEKTVPLTSLNHFRQQLKSSSRFWGKRSDATETDSMKQKLKSSSRFWGKRNSEDEEQADQEISRKKRSANQEQQLMAEDTNALKEKLKASSRFWGKRSLGLPSYLKRKLLNPANVIGRHYFSTGFIPDESSNLIEQPPQDANEPADEQEASIEPNYALEGITSESEENGAKQQHLQGAPLDGDLLRQQSDIDEDANLQLLRSLDAYQSARK